MRPLLCHELFVFSFHSVFFHFALFISEICFYISPLYAFLFFSIWHHYPHLHSLSPFHPLPHYLILLCTAEREREGGRGRRPEIDVGPAHTESGSWLNRSDRSGTEHLLCQTAGPLWMEIISKLLQEADACQKMLSVKVRLLWCCLALSFSLSVTLLLSSSF